MPTEPPQNGRPNAEPPSTPLPQAQAKKSPVQIERSQFGGTQRPHKRTDEGDAPFSRSDLRKGAQDLMGDGTAHISWSVLLVSSAVILAFSIWAILLPEGSSTTMKSVVDCVPMSNRFAAARQSQAYERHGHQGK